MMFPLKAGSAPDDTHELLHPVVSVTAVGGSMMPGSLRRSVYGLPALFRAARMASILFSRAKPMAADNSSSQ